MATTLRTPLWSKPVATEANAPSAISSSIADWHAFRTTGGMACSRKKALKSPADFGSALACASSKIK
jgi:hypothetical protein